MEPVTAALAASCSSGASFSPSRSSAEAACSSAKYTSAAISPCICIRGSAWRGRNQQLHLCTSKLMMTVTMAFFLLFPVSPITGVVGETLCTSRDISISQNRVGASQSRLDRSSIPQFIVQIMNTCLSGCTPSDIHVNCGWFASTEMVNPLIFRRIAPNDCLVNGGCPLQRDHIIQFTYQNSFMYPLSFKSASFC
ncbi:hypothetical protein KP509_06G009800 [Ceratopteris richardii]|uniref:Uncharacterized protein n=1 Tax=Ceratopteris richardii TaxID=49495 RepID=A0A8T2ULR0_CERRI|nr:hypothetical protein KP509_06G009800 [Ceratopteris richardii]